MKKKKKKDDHSVTEHESVPRIQLYKKNWTEIIFTLAVKMMHVKISNFNFKNELEKL